MIVQNKFHRHLFLAYNTILGISGIVVIIIGKLIFDDNEYSILSRLTVHIETPTVAFLVAGGLVILVCLIGCYLATAPRLGLISVYVMLLCCCFLAELTVGVYVLDNWENELTKQVETNLQNLFVLHDNTSVELLDEIQSTIICCGINGRNDYEVYNLSIPDSCKLTRRGCIKPLIKWSQSNLKILGGLGVGFSVLEVIGCCLSVYLIRYIKRQLTSDSNQSLSEHRISNKSV